MLSCWDSPSALLRLERGSLPSLRYLHLEEISVLTNRSLTVAVNVSGTADMSMFAPPPLNSERYAHRSPHSAMSSFHQPVNSSVGLGLDYSHMQRPAVEHHPRLPLRKSFAGLPRLSTSTDEHFHCLSDQVRSTDALKICRSPSGTRFGDRATYARIATGEPRKKSISASPGFGPTSAFVEHEQDTCSHGDDEMAVNAIEQEDDLTGGDTPKTAAERQAEKRKMKRFRYLY